MAGVLGSGQDAVASHASAAALLDLRHWSSGRVHVTVPRRGARSRKGVVVHETRSLDDDEVTERDGLPCTSAARTLVDFAADATSAELQRVLEQSVRLNLFDRNALERYHGRRGMARLTRLIAELVDEAPLTRRELERLFLDLVLKARLPVPVVNARIGNNEVDFHWPDHMLVVETDSHAFHNNAVAFRRDRRRDLDLELSGWHVLRFGWHDVVDDSDRVVALLRRRLPTE